MYDFTLHLRIRDHTNMILEVSWDGLWTLSFGFSQLHDHVSRLMCEVALSHIRLLAHFNEILLLHNFHIMSASS